MQSLLLAGQITDGLAEVMLSVWQWSVVSWHDLLFFLLTYHSLIVTAMHKAWPKLLRRMKAGKWGDAHEDHELVVQSRIWFCLYLFEHQYAIFSIRCYFDLCFRRLSYGTGRPAILKDDESIWHCRLLLQHPLAIEDDMRLVSTVELMAIRERVNNKMSPYDQPVSDETFHILRDADMEFSTWYATWDHAFSQKYEDAGKHPVIIFLLSDLIRVFLSLLSAKPANPAIPRHALPQRNRAQRS